MASYLNINFKGHLVDPARLAEGKEIRVMEMCDAAVKFGFYTMLAIDATTEDGFDLLVTQLSQSQRPDQSTTTTTKCFPHW